MKSWFAVGLMAVLLTTLAVRSPAADPPSNLEARVAALEAEVAAIEFQLRTLQPPGTLTSRGDRARVISIKSTFSSLRTALDAFEVDTGRYPTSEEGIDALVKQPAGLNGWHGPYLAKVPLDPWQHPFIYRLTAGDHIEIRSLGPDGVDSDDDIRPD